MAAGYRYSSGGECLVTTSRKGTVTAPYVIPLKAAGQKLVLGAPLVRMLSQELGLVEEAPLLETIAQHEATIEEKDAQIDALRKEVESMRFPAERYYALISNDDATDFERQIAEGKAQIKTLQHQLLQHNRGGKPAQEREQAA